MEGAARKERTRTTNHAEEERFFFFALRCKAPRHVSLWTRLRIAEDRAAQGSPLQPLREEKERSAAGGAEASLFPHDQQPAAFCFPSSSSSLKNLDLDHFFISLKKKKKKVSGAVPEEPVVSKVSGHLFERRLLEKAVADSGVDPVTKAPMRFPEDAVVVRATGGAASSAVAAPKPRPSPAASVPGLIGLFRDEWDALALETHQLRASLHSARQELAHALYQHDAALRVIARLSRERDAARDAYEASSSLPPPAAASEEASRHRKAAGAASGDQQQQPEKREQGEQPAAKKARGAAGGGAGPAALRREVVEAITSLSETLSKGRKKRVPPAGCATAESARAFSELGGSPHALHKARAPGVSCVATAPSSSLVASGGLDGDVSLFDASKGTTVASLAHCAGGGDPKTSAAARRGVTDVAFVRRALLASAGADGAVRLWRPTEEDSDEFLATDADAAASSSWAVCAEAAAEAPGGDGLSSSSAASPSAVVALAVHPSRDYLAAAGADGEWRLYDLGAATAAAKTGGAPRSPSSRASGAPLSRLVSGPDAASGGYSSAAFHPDGVILGAGTRGGAVRIWDARSLKAVARFEGHDASAAAFAGVTGLAFSENGYYLATGASDGVKAWDLRKLKNLASVPGPPGAGEGGGGGGGGGASRLAFDPSGYLLAVAGPGGVSILGSKQEWAPLCQLAGGGEGRRKGGALSVAWSSAGDVLFAGGSDHCLRAFGAPASPLA